jgi:hypothetical protein
MPAIRSLRNLDLVKSVSYKDASVYDIFTGGMIVMDEGVFAKKAEVKAKTEVVKKTVKKTTKTK